MEKSKYIVIDGMDGAGKSSLFQRLHHDQRFNTECVFTREPGGTAFGEQLRSLVLNNKVEPLTEMFTFLASRSEVRAAVVLPSLKKGKHVISDRSESATYAYQICARNGRHLEELFWFAHSKLAVQPDFYIIYDLDPAIAYNRMASSPNARRDVFEQEELEFFQKVRQGYKEFAKHRNCVFIDAEQTEDEVYNSVTGSIESFLKT